MRRFDGSPGTAYDRGMLTKPSACPLDCPDTCSLELTVDASGTELLGVAGDARNPLTEGVICGKVRRFAERVHHRLRLTQPYRRVGGTKAAGSFPRDFEPCSWDAALGLVAERFAAVREEFGGEAILPVSYGGSNGVLTEGLVDERLWRRLGALRLHRNVCAAPSGAACAGLYGKMPGADLRDHVHADLIIVWGCNPHASGMHHVAVVQAAQKRGAKLVVIDPRRTPLAGRADMHLALAPGSDLVVALAIVRELFERGWHDADFIARHTTGADVLRERAAEWTLERAAEVARLDVAELAALVELYHASANPVIRLGWGLERNRNGASACAAVIALPALAGKFGQRGGGFTASLSRSLELEPGVAIQAAPTATREVELSQVGAELTADDRIRAAFIYNCNPLSTLPDQNAVVRGFGRADLFTVVFEQVANDSVDFADVVLPATTFAEHAELKKAYGVAFAYRAEPAIAPVGQARPNAPVFAELVERLGLAEPSDPTTEAALADAIIAHGGPTPTQQRELRTTGSTTGAFEAEHGAAPIPFVDHFPNTPDQRVHLAPADMPELYRYQAPPASEQRWPLALISPAHIRMTTSTFGESLEGIQSVILHPADMQKYGLTEGDKVRLFNDLGECHTTVTTNGEGPRPGVAVLPKGLWRHHTLNGRTSNALAPTHLSDYGRGACYNDARIALEKR